MSRPRLAIVPPPDAARLLARRLRTAHALLPLLTAHAIAEGRADACASIDIVGGDVLVYLSTGGRLAEAFANGEQLDALAGEP